MRWLIVVMLLAGCGAPTPESKYELVYQGREGDLIPLAVVAAEVTHSPTELLFLAEYHRTMAFLTLSGLPNSHSKARSTIAGLDEFSPDSDGIRPDFFDAAGRGLLEITVFSAHRITGVFVGQFTHKGQSRRMVLKFDMKL